MLDLPIHLSNSVLVARMSASDMRGATRRRVSLRSPGLRGSRQASAISRHDPPELLRNGRPQNNGGRREGRELAAPMARLRKKMQAAGTTGSAKTSRPSLRDGFTAASYSSWCAGLFGHHPPCNAKHHHGVDTSIGVSEPYDLTVRAIIVRRRPCDGTLATPRGHRSPHSTYRDDAYAPPR